MAASPRKRLRTQEDQGDVPLGGEGKLTAEELGPREETKLARKVVES